jgi:hypothetical protein
MMLVPEIHLGRGLTAPQFGAVLDVDQPILAIAS